MEGEGFHAKRLGQSRKSGWRGPDRDVRGGKTNGGGWMRARRCGRGSCGWGREGGESERRYRADVVSEAFCQAES